MNNKAKGLTIVCDKKSYPYANYLKQLIGLKDDEDDKIIGVKDGSVKAVILMEEEYKPTHTTSNDFVIFIGNGKVSKDQRTYLIPSFSKYGINYGSTGTQAALWVDEDVKLNEYEAFVKFAQEYDVKIEKMFNFIKCKKSKAAELAIKSCVIGGAFLAGSFAGAAVASGLILSDSISIAPISEEIQYGCAIKKFYLEELATFMQLQQ